ENLVAWLNAAFSDERTWPQLIHCATDGETYGHHSRFGEMALAAAVQQIEAEGTVTLTNYGAFLAANPPTHEVEIRERTSWSCAHGIERWRADCGCRTRGDWHQRWRAPLREALDWLRDQIDPFFEARASAYLKDPWAARDAYVAVVLDRSAERLDTFFAVHARAPLDADARVYAYRVQRLDEAREASDGTAIRIAHVRVSSEITGEARDMMYALLHFGGHDFSCGIRVWEDRAVYDAMKADLLDRFARQSVADLVRGLDEHFPGGHSSLSHLFLDERRRMLADLIRATLEKHEETYRR